MSRVSLTQSKKIENFARWEKKKVEKSIQEQLFKRSSEITEALIARCLIGDTAAMNIAYDRMFGKAKQSLDIDTGGAPVVIALPGVLVAKFSLGETTNKEPIPVEAEIINYGETTTKRKIQLPSRTRTNSRRQAQV